MAGEWVNEDRALTISAVFACVRNISEDVASLPLNLMYRDADRTAPAEWRREYELLRAAPNSYQTSMDFRETFIASMLLTGNAIAEKEKTIDKSSIYALHFVEPERFQGAHVDDGRIIYVIDGKELTRSDILFSHAFSTDGITGRSVLRLARDTFGLTKATERFGSSYFANGATPGGVIEWDRKFMNEDAVKRFMLSWTLAHGGAAKHGKTAVLEDGMKYKNIGIPPEDSQFLETRKFQITDIARFFRMPPHKIGDLEKATFSNIEHQGIEYVTSTLGPWIVRIEQSLNLSLLSQFDRKQYFFKHNVDALLRGDIASRYDAYSTGRMWGWLSVNDIRRKEDMDPVEGGDEYLRPVNMEVASTKNSRSRKQADPKQLDLIREEMK